MSVDLVELLAATGSLLVVLDPAEPGARRSSWADSHWPRALLGSRGDAEQDVPFGDRTGRCAAGPVPERRATSGSRTGVPGAGSPHKRWGAGEREALFGYGVPRQFDDAGLDGSIAT